MDLGGFLLVLGRLSALVVGGFIIGASLTSAIRTFVLPRSAPDRIVRFVFVGIRRLFDLRTHNAPTYERRDQIMAMYAPLALLALPVAWLVLVALGGGLIEWALKVGAVHDAVLFSASAVLTLGATPITGLLQTGLAFAEAVVGLLLTAILIAYLPTMYSAFSARETLVTMLEVRAGSPPTPSTMFQRFNRLQNLEALAELWRDWELWFTQLEETHTSLPALAFFRSPQAHRSWITAAGAVLDSAALSLALLDIPSDYHASLTIRAGFLALRQICDFFGIDYNANPQPTDSISVQREEFDEVANELAGAGIPLKADREQAWRDYKGWRVNYDVPLVALARLVMAPYAPWSSDRSIRRVRAKLWFKPRKA